MCLLVNIQGDSIEKANILEAENIDQCDRNVSTSMCLNQKGYQDRAI